MATFIRVVLFAGETPTKILSGEPSQLNAQQLDSSYDLREIDPTVTRTQDVPPKSSLPRPPGYSSV